MSEMISKLKVVKSMIGEKNSRIAQQVDEMIHSVNHNPMIEQFARPSTNVRLKEDNGTVHSFAVEIKSNQDGPIPDTQLMSKILQAIESHNGANEDTLEMASSDVPKFEVVSFKYERREDNKKKQ